MKSKKKDTVDEKKVSNRWFIGGVVVVIFAIIIPCLIVYLTKTSLNAVEIGKLGTIGDFLGGSTVGLLSLASILFVIHTIAIQSKELELQRQELVQTRNEFKVGNNTAKVQQIDNAFFNMLTLQNQIVNSIKLDEGNSFVGRSAIAELKRIFEYEYFKKSYADNLTPEHFYWEAQTTTQINKMIKIAFEEENFVEQSRLDIVYKDFHSKYGNIIGHYMRHNYRIVKFIVENVASNEQEQLEIKERTGRIPIIADKRFYFGMLRAQWSNSEFELILINSLYKVNHKFKTLILAHDVLDIRDEKVIKDSFVLKDSMKTFKAYRTLIEKVNQ